MVRIKKPKTPLPMTEWGLRLFRTCGERMEMDDDNIHGSATTGPKRNTAMQIHSAGQLSSSLAASARASVKSLK